MAVPVAERSTYGVGELVRLLLAEGIRTSSSDWAVPAPTTAALGCWRHWV